MNERINSEDLRKKKAGHVCFDRRFLENTDEIRKEIMKRTQAA